MSAVSAARARLGELGRGAGALFAWWLDELLGLLPARLRRRFHLHREQVELRVTEDAIELGLVSAGERRSLGAFPRAGGEAALLAETLEATRGKDRRLVMQLPGDDVLVREIGLPLAVEENLSQVLRYEMDRYTPFKADAVYFGSRIVRRDAGQQRLHVQLVVVPRERLEHWLGELRAWGIEPDSVEAESVPGVDLAAAARKAPAARRGLGLRGILVALIVLLLVGEAVLPLWKMREVVIELNRELSGMETLADRVAGLRDQRDRLLAQSRFLVDKARSQSIVEALEELAGVLPDDTWVQSLQYGDGGLTIQGQSASASDLIARLEASPLFEAVSFAAPVTRNAASGNDLFQITLSLREEAP